MPKKAPAWFPLKIYSQKNIPIEKWLNLMVFRLIIRTNFHNTEDYQKALNLFQTMIVDEQYIPALLKDDEAIFFEKEPRLPVTMLNIFESLWLYKNCNKQKISKWNRLANNFMKKKPRHKWFLTKKNAENTFDYIDKARLQGVHEMLDFRVPLSIDITADNESLIEGFKLWLSCYRHMSNKNAQKPITQKILDNWQNFKVLAAFDLQLWAEINNLHYTDTDMGNFLFPDEDTVDTTERYRKVVKLKVKEILGDWFMIERLSSQINRHKWLNVLKSETKNKKNVPE